jgi:tetratricopeptide (TPR) repeat protein
MRTWYDLLQQEKSWIRYCWPLSLLILAVVSILIAAPYLKVWHHFQAGQAALERYHAEEALVHFNACLQVCPEDCRVRLLASRAAWRAGHFEEASRHLESCQNHLGLCEEILLEWALQRAAAGDLTPAEKYLQARLKRQDFLPQGPLICEALVLGYLHTYRFRDARNCLNYWLEQQPDNVQALFLRAAVYLARKQLQKAADDYRRVLQLDPQRREARMALISCLLDVEVRAYSEALPLLQEMLHQQPDDANAQVMLALCREGLAQPQEAAAILDRVLQEHPDHGLALRERGQLALQEGQATEAEHWIRQSLAVMPQDLVAHNCLLRCLQQQGKTTEAQLQRERIEQLQKWYKRLREITEQISQRPYDPALYCEIGILNVRLGRPDLGYRWLLYARSLDANYQPAQAALAEYFGAELQP